MSVACHDIRTPLATIAGFAKTMIRAGELPEREERFTGMIDEAASQIAAQLDLLGLAARIASRRYQPALAEIDTLELAQPPDRDARIVVRGDGTRIETDPDVVCRSLAAFALAALRHGELDGVTWTVSGRELELSPLTDGAAPVVDGSSPRDLGAIVARMAVECLGGSVEVAGAALSVRL